MFAYCLNNPINCIDATGCWPSWFVDVVDWLEEHIDKPVKEFIDNVKNDYNAYDSSNESATVVFNANYFSCYKGVFVLKTPFDTSFSFGFIGLSKDRQTETSLKHEYGHAVQMQNMGTFQYTTSVAIPSLTINILSRQGKLPYDYFGAPFEAEADAYGDVNRQYNNKPWPEDVYNSYWDLLEWF